VGLTAGANCRVENGIRHQGLTTFGRQMITVARE
jgi:hypothetical protein